MSNEALMIYLLVDTVIAVITYFVVYKKDD